MIEKSKKPAYIGEIRTWGGKEYVKTPRGWILSNSEVEKQVDDEIRSRNEEAERRFNDDPEFRNRYLKEHGKGLTMFTTPNGHVSVREVAGIRLRNSEKEPGAKNLVALYSSDIKSWVIPSLEGNTPLTYKIWKIILEKGKCEIYLRKTKDSAPYRVMVEEKEGKLHFTDAVKREGVKDEWKPSVGDVLDVGLSGPHLYSVDVVIPQDEPLEKAKAAMVGEERTWGGKVYVKTVKGWRPKGKGSSSVKQDESEESQPTQPVNETQDRKSVLEGYASNATNQQLETAIEKPGQSEEVKQIARQELESRSASAKEGADEIGDALNRLLESDEFDDEFKRIVKEKLDERNAKKQEKQKDSIRDELDSFKKEINQRLDKLEQENSGHKQIKKTGIVVDGKKIFITMNGDRYQARRGGETLKSEPGESLSSFKDKVRKKWEGVLTDNHDTNGTKPSNKDRLPHNPKVESAVDRAKKIINDSDFKKGDEYKVVLKNPEKALTVKSDKQGQLQLNAALLEKGFKPVMEPFMFTDYNNKKYESYDEYFIDQAGAFSKYVNDFAPSMDDLNSNEFNAIASYIEGYDGDVRRLNMNPKSNAFEDKKKIQSISENLESYINNHRLKNNIILSRRLRFNEKDNPFSKLKQGDVFMDYSFSSYSLQQLGEFGSDFQITLLAKKSQPVSPVSVKFTEEMEFLVQKGSTFRVIETGFNSIAVEIVD